jgi:hypothetical protein
MPREHKDVLNLERETQAATALRDALLRLPDIEPDRDAELIGDMVEGETNLREMIAKVMEHLAETEIMLVGIDNKLDTFGSRKRRYVERKEMLRAMIEQAMVIGEIKKLELPDATLSLAHRAGGVVIVDEMKIPADYWRKLDPEIDKAKVSSVLKEGLEVPGATLGNGTISLTVRRS